MNNIKRRKTKRIKLGSVYIGGNSPISVQTMTNTKTEDYDKTIKQIDELISAGAEIIRLTIPTNEAVFTLKKIKNYISIPIIADIHFDYNMAIKAIEAGADGIRINPGNFPFKKLDNIIDAAKQNDRAIRIGVNAGSLKSKYLKKYGAVEGLVGSALDYIDIFEKRGFNNIKVSVKSSDVINTIQAYRMIASKCDYPLHLGITEAGIGDYAIVKSSIGIGSLLLDGIGDTIRVSLTGNPVKEVYVGKAILRSLSLREEGVEIISCPTCGRCTIDIENLAKKIEQLLSNCKIPVKIAVMGCIVNGPGEARQADYGIAAENGEAVIFKKGRVLMKVKEEDILQNFLNLLTNEGLISR
ncbi:MAG: flavodoxin-dependent (E)-4-hydroxy-3-methylbut-2-enyl-diphosphate synthase [Deferribacterota bacterium]|nr:flavodoxin-dependent (E)-4-hydroxy-3-methylbut-2-enyl-diphosphate synthase [Deferribacterota bacterium]